MKFPPLEIRCASSEQRRRRFFGFVGIADAPVAADPRHAWRRAAAEHREPIDAAQAGLVPWNFGEEAEEVVGCQRGDLLAADAAHVGQNVRRVDNECRLVALSAMRRRGEIGRIGFHQNPIRWKIARYVFDILRILERQDARERDIVAERNSGLGQRPPGRKAMQDGRESPLLHFALQDRRKIGVRLARMDHERQAGSSRRGNVSQKPRSPARRAATDRSGSRDPPPRSPRLSDAQRAAPGRRP